MSTDPATRRGRSRTRRARAFAATFAIVVVALAVTGAAAAAVGVAQGPRVTATSVDPEAAVAASGSRLIVTTSQALAPVDASQVTVEPAVPFAVDTSGRSVGVRFGMPLRDETTYTVTIDDVEGAGGGPRVTLIESFTTPAIDVQLLQRAGDGDDTIFRTDLSGEQAVPLFTHPHIEDYRATRSHLVISTRTDDDRAALVTTSLAGEDARELPLPGEGTVSNLQASDRGEMIGYTFSDADLGAAGGLESALFTASLTSPGEPPTAIEVEGADPRVAEWRFVPETDSILLLGFDGTLLLTGSGGGDATALGSALSIDGIAGTDAIVERLDGLVVIDLTDGTEKPLVAADDDFGTLGRVVPVPGGGTLRAYAEVDASGLLSPVSLVTVSDDGSSRVVGEVDPSDALVQLCVSPSGRYAAILVAPDAVSNPYDTYLLPMPERLETRVVELDDGDEVVALAGFDISWCRVPPA